MTAIGDMPIAAFDLETTGPNPLSDRIVTAHLSLINPATGEIHPRDWLLNPEIDIPAGATAVHGITTEHAAEHGAEYAPGVEEIATALVAAWGSGHIVVAFNGCFDLTMVHAEAERLSIGGLPLGPVVDPFVIDKRHDKYRKGSRKLGDVCAHYGITLDNAHEAAADALAAARLAYKLLRRYNLAGKPAEQLMHQQAGWYAEQQTSLANYWCEEAEELTGDEQADLLSRAASVTTEWPIKHPQLAAA
ncbi:exonuclease domain-containing protein [Rhodococcus qingshengii]|uniref:exonuclease domain-containing protein n=1 Tax=Rhodococcus qingshengii TaxID=334542 RepID=UPI001C8CCE1D|nr:exonuclease domain-containing protein [Rhodococcus qingshengii]MBX9150045.1 3'-5' exonuclease [Rhodococcus qingshengii]